MESEPFMDQVHDPLKQLICIENLGQGTARLGDGGHLFRPPLEALDQAGAFYGDGDVGGQRAQDDQIIFVEAVGPVGLDIENA